MNGSNMNLSFNLETIYDDANFQINDFDKVGVVGVNGAGKTTLFKVILKKLSLDSGKIFINSSKRIGYLPQEVILDDKELSVFDYLMKARPIEELEKELINLYDLVAEAVGNEQDKILNKISKVQSLLDYYDCYKAESIMLEIIGNMGIDSNLLDMKLDDSSGGQKSKIAFAHLLYSNPEILLLDEPTNHLDVDTKEYITNYLKNYKGMVLIISHDVPFLNQIIGRILFLDKASNQITMYDGNYDEYLKKRAKQKELKERLIDKQEKEIDKLRTVVLQYSNSSGNRKKMAQSREKMLSKKLETVEERDSTLKKDKIEY